MRWVTTAYADVLLDTPLPSDINGRVRVIILVEDDADDVGEQ